MNNIQIENILKRKEIKLDIPNIELLIKNKIILITGAGGTIGSELCYQLASYKPKRLIILDIYENTLYETEIELKTHYKNIEIKTVVANIRENDRLIQIFSDNKPHLVFHAAAHKHVPLMEENPLEAIRNNVLGTYNVINCADEFQAEKFIFISSDKAVNPSNIMGATKRICEMLIQAKAKVSTTNYAAVRFCNVLESNGSVVNIFKKQIQSGGPITLTAFDTTRYFMTKTEAVGLILQATTFASSGEIFLLNIQESIKIHDLALALLKSSSYQNIDIEIIGLRSGEKLHEELLVKDNHSCSSTKHRNIYITKPSHPEIKKLEAIITLFKTINYDNYNRDKFIKSILKELIPEYKE